MADIDIRVSGSGGQQAAGNIEQTTAAVQKLTAAINDLKAAATSVNLGGMNAGAVGSVGAGSPVARGMGGGPAGAVPIRPSQMPSVIPAAGSAAPLPGIPKPGGRIADPATWGISDAEVQAFHSAHPGMSRQTAERTLIARAGADDYAVSVVDAWYAAGQPRGGIGAVPPASRLPSSTPGGGGGGPGAISAGAIQQVMAANPGMSWGQAAMMVQNGGTMPEPLSTQRARGSLMASYERDFMQGQAANRDIDYRYRGVGPRTFAEEQAHNQALAEDARRQSMRVRPGEEMDAAQSRAILENERRAAAAESAQINNMRSQARAGRVDAFTGLMVSGIAGGIGRQVLRGDEWALGQYGQSQLTKIGVEAINGRAAAPGLIEQARRDALDIYGASYRDVLRSESQLQQSGETQPQARQMVKSLSDVNAAMGGSNESLQRMILNLSQIEQAGRLTGRELRDFHRNLVPLQTYLARTLNLTTAEVSRRVSSGQISAEDVRAAITAMEADPRFHERGKVIERTTLPGQLEALREEAEKTGEIIGERLTPSLLRLMGGLRTGVEWLNRHPGTAGAVGFGTAGAGVALTVGGAAGGVYFMREMLISSHLQMRAAQLQLEAAGINTGGKAAGGMSAVGAASAVGAGLAIGTAGYQYLKDTGNLQWAGVNPQDQYNNAGSLVGRFGRNFKEGAQLLALSHGVRIGSGGIDWESRKLMTTSRDELEQGHWAEQFRLNQIRQSLRSQLKSGKITTDEAERRLFEGETNVYTSAGRYYSDRGHLRAAEENRLRAANLEAQYRFNRHGLLREMNFEMADAGTAAAGDVGGGVGVGAVKHNPDMSQQVTIHIPVHPQVRRVVQDVHAATR